MFILRTIYLLFLMDEVMRQIFLRIFLFTPVSLHSAIAPNTYHHHQHLVS